MGGSACQEAVIAAMVRRPGNRRRERAELEGGIDAVF
jgi:hypothetical protein